MLHVNDLAVLRAARTKPDLVLWDQYGYPAHKASRILAEQLKKNETDVYYALKHLKSLGAFEAGFDPRKPLKNDGAFFSLAECIGNPNAEPVEIPAIKKTNAAQIVDAAIKTHLALIPEPKYVEEYVPEGDHYCLVGQPQHFPKAELLNILEPLAQAMRDLAVLFPSDDRASWCNRVAVTQDQLRKLVDGHQTEFSYAELQTVSGYFLKGLRTLETELEKHLPEIPADKETEKPKSLGLRVLKSSQVQPELIEWLWKDRIPLGKLTLFSGNPDVGKSLVSLDVAARLSCGKDFPDGKNTLGACDVLILAAEDDPADTIVPRLMAAGADLDRIHLLDGTNVSDMERSFALDSDVQLLREHLAENPEIRLVIVDPISNYLGSAELNKETELRKVLTPLVNVARDAECAVLTIAHFNKQLGTDAIHKVGGAVGLVGIQRMAWAFTKNPDDPDARLMLRIKGNISANSKGLGYRTSGKEISIQGQPAVLPVVEWLGESAETADNILQISSDPEARSARNISNWLREFLKDGEQPASEVFKEAEKKFGNAGDRVRRASEQLNVAKRQENRRWFWSLPLPETELPF